MREGGSDAMPGPRGEPRVKAGRTASLVLLSVVTAIVVAVEACFSFVEPLTSIGPVMHLIIIGAVTAIAAALLLIPAGVAMDKSIGRLQQYVQSATVEAAEPAYYGPRWLRPVTHAFLAAVEQFRTRERTLRNQVRDLEIRHRVADVEQQQIRAVLNSLRDGVIVTDPFNEIVMANEAAAIALQFDLDNAIHQPIESVISDARVRQLVTDRRDSSNFSDRHVVEHEIEIGEGDTRHMKLYDISLMCVENHKHEVGGVVTILHDRTHERELAQRETDFVSKASHELRTPLSSIRAYVEMLVDGEAQDEKARDEFYRIIHAEADRLGRLIDNMLNISRIEAGIVQIDRQQVDMKSLIKRAADTIEPQAREKDITVLVKLAPVGLTVEGDPDMLFQVILNLLSNAVKYTPESGRVTVSADSDNLTRSVLVSVADTGLGIPPDALPKLFEKFYRVENYKRVAKGTGLGLSLCKHIVETVHYGQIGIESKLGMGSRFWFSIPMRYAGIQEAA